MKKIILLTMTSILMLLCTPTLVQASNGADPVNDSIAAYQQASVLVARLEEINDLDVTALTRIQKRELRREVRTINKDLNAIYNGGIYISVGAAILIVLLLILLL
jgi:hypothetical protein